MTPAPSLYDGDVVHHRLHPREHRFVYRVCAFLLDIDTLAETARRCRWFSLNRFNLFSFHHRDFGDGGAPRDHLERVLRRHGVEQSPASAALLCYPRVLGYSFNPLAVYYCYDAHERLFAVLYEVNNTFGQRHSYLIRVDEPAGAGAFVSQDCDKRFYVSPFMSMDQRYRFRLQVPADSAAVSICQTEGSRKIMRASFRGRRRAFDDRQLLRTFFRLPWMTVKVIAAIHWQALRLWLKGVPLVPRPQPPARSVTLGEHRFTRESGRNTGETAR